jgi:hypothetical protein
MQAVRSLVWGYWMPTNSFCGPVEVFDRSGRAVPRVRRSGSILTNYSRGEVPLDVEPSDFSGYPAAYDLRMAHARYFSQFTFYSGPRIFPVPLFVVSPRSELARFVIGEEGRLLAATPFERSFQLDDFFDLRQPGEYTVRVWPKIYKLSTQSTNLCERIDLPPISVGIRWEPVTR